MDTVSGTIMKMKSTLSSSGDVSYSLPLGDSLTEMNGFLGKKITLTWHKKIYDIHDGELIKKSYAQGHSYKNLMKLPQCDTCIVKPELCHFDKGTCRDPEWGQRNCMIPHYIYLSITSGVKIGITRETQLPTRWIDQGAVKAIPIAKVGDRKSSGLVEIEIAKEMADKTNWRNMLKGVYEDANLEMMREQIYDSYGDLLDDMGAEEVEDSETIIKYPILSLPEKISSMSFDKSDIIEGTLTGVKGQYLIFDNGVINMRKHQGYEITLNAQG
jgi:hypothetical protein